MPLSITPTLTPAPVAPPPSPPHTWGAPMNGTDVKFSMRLGTSGWTALTPGRARIRSSDAPSTCTAMPL